MLQSNEWPAPSELGQLCSNLPISLHGRCAVSWDNVEIGLWGSRFSTVQVEQLSDLILYLALLTLRAQGKKKLSKKSENQSFIYNSKSKPKSPPLWGPGCSSGLSPEVICFRKSKQSPSIHPSFFQMEQVQSCHILPDKQEEEPKKVIAASFLLAFLAHFPPNVEKTPNPVRVVFC